MAGEAIIIMKSRERRAVLSYLSSAGAFSEADAVSFAPATQGEATALSLLMGTGDVRLADERYYIDRKQLAAKGKRRWAVLAGLCLAAVGIALLA